MINSKLTDIIDEGLDFLENNFSDVNILQIEVTEDLLQGGGFSYRGHQVVLCDSSPTIFSPRVFIRANNAICLWWWNGKIGREWVCDGLKRKDPSLKENSFAGLFLKVLKGTRD